MIDVSLLTVAELQHKPESLYFDRKSARIEPKDIIRHIVAFANANGGTLAIGIENDSTVTGFGINGAHSIDEYKTEILRKCLPVPECKYSTMVYGDNPNDFILLISVGISQSTVIRTKNEKVFLRSNDSTMELTYSQILALEYDKGQRIFEDQVVENSSVDDIDLEILNQYKRRMGVEGKTPEAILDARGLIKNSKLTNAAVLLFGKNPTKFLPSARIRFIRYDGKDAGVGRNINIIKEQTFDDAIPVVIGKIQNLIKTQLRDFQTLDASGKFEIIPEYPEFTWFEGIVNALTHRDYRIAGDHIRITMFDDRLQILSPGKLPNIVSLQNMKSTRYSRNPRIARFLSEFGWVKELNEGVNRIYSEMQSFFLNAPIYSEPNDNAVLLTLENSITSRHLRNGEKLSKDIFQSVWKALNDNEKAVLHYLYTRDSINTKSASLLLGKSIVTTREMLKRLAKKNIIIWHGSSAKDPSQYYTLNTNFND